MVEDIGAEEGLFDEGDDDEAGDSVDPMLVV